MCVCGERVCKQRALASHMPRGSKWEGARRGGGGAAARCRGTAGPQLPSGW